MGSWANKDGLNLLYGTDKAKVESGGDYLAYGPNRVAECLIDLSTLNTSNATIVSDTLILPAMANIYVEKVELTAEVLMSTASSPTLSIGVSGTDLNYASGTNVTWHGTVYTPHVPSNGGTAFVSGAAASTLTEGAVLTIIKGGTAAGNYLGDYEDTSNLTYPTYLTATLGTATATGLIRFRLYYHGVGTITH